MSRILIVDDEKVIVKGLTFSLQQDGTEVDAAYDGEEALALAKKNRYDVILLDIMLPKLDGYEVCRRIRETSDVPIIMLTARGEDPDKIRGLNTGADDYMTKPFNILEVKARIAAVMRRSARRAEPEQAPAETAAQDADTHGSRGRRPARQASGLRLDPESRRAFLNRKEIMLTSREFEVLSLLMEHPGKVYSRESLLSLVWGIEEHRDARMVDVHIRRLREKIEPDPGNPKYVHTKWGVGYYFEA